MLNKILYIGYEPNTVNYILEKGENKVVAVAKLDILNVKTNNPINLLFYFLYSLREKNLKQAKLLEYTLFRICFLLYFFTTGIYKIYGKYILGLYENKVEVWNLNQKIFVDRIKKEIDLIIVNVWGLLSEDIFNAPRLGSINIHPSKLPKNIGAVPTLWALRNNEIESAVSYIYITEKGIDLGDLIFQETFNIDHKDNIISIEDKVLTIIHKTINDVIDIVIKGKKTPVSQNFTEMSKTPKYEEYREIKPILETSREISNKVMGYPYVIYGEYCYIKIRERKIYIKNLHKLGDMNLSRTLNLIIKCQDGVSLYAKLFFDVNINDSLYLIFNKIK